jgi:hypothetical protein
MYSSVNVRASIYSKWKWAIVWALALIYIKQTNGLLLLQQIKIWSSHMPQKFENTPSLLK